MIKSKKTSYFIKRMIFGILFGIGIIIPGLSGSAIAISFGLYPLLLASISNLFKHFKISITFLFPIILGSLFGIVLGFIFIKKLLSTMPFTTTSLFASLMLASFIKLTKDKNEKLNKKYILIGILIPIILTIVSFIKLKDNVKYISIFSNPSLVHLLIFIIIGYLIAITQIVPGLSATSLLMILGCFKPLLDTLNIEYIKNHFVVLSIYLAMFLGVLIGTISFSKVMNYLFKNKYQSTYSMILGLSIISIVLMFINNEIILTYKNWYNNHINYFDLIIGIIIFIFIQMISKVLLKYKNIKLLY